MPRVPFDKFLHVLEENQLIAYGAMGMLGLGPILFASFMAGLFPLGILGLHVTLMGLALWFANQRINLRARRRQAQVHADHEGVRQNGKLVVPRAKIADGFFQPRLVRDPNKGSSYGSSVRLVDRRRRVLFEVEAEEDEALEMLAALGLDPSSKRAEFRGASPLYSTASLTMLTTFVLTFGTFAATVLLTTLLGAHTPFLPLFTVPLFFAGMWPSKIAIGIDGVLVRWMWRKKFIPMAQIAGMERVDDREIRLRLANGGYETLHTSMRRKNNWGTSGLVAQHRDAIYARISEALLAFRARGTAADVSALVGKGSRTHREWLDALGKLRSEEGGYREAVVRDDDLWRVVEDPAAPEDARAGAALVLRRSLDEAGKERVRIAAEATASPKLRVALDAAAGASGDDALHDALEDLAPPEMAEKRSARGDA